MNKKIIIGGIVVVALIGVVYWVSFMKNNLISNSSSSESITGDKDCGDFSTHDEAQAYFISRGGPSDDPDRLDKDKDGIACETLP